MARPRTIDREDLLGEAEKIVMERGAAQLSFGSLAAATQLPKASIQSAFGTREHLLDALVDRWMMHDSKRYRTHLGEDQSPESRLQAHLATTAGETAEGGRRIASVLAALVGSGSQSKNIKSWYEERLGSLEAESDEARCRRRIYLAAEGAYHLRYMALLDIDDACWRDIFDDLYRQMPRCEAAIDGLEDGA